MSKQLTPASSASTVGPCPTIIQIVGRPGTGSLPRTFAPPDHPREAEGGGSDEGYSGESGRGDASGRWRFG